MSADAFLMKVDRYILNPIIGLLFAVAFLVFFVGVIRFIASATADEGRDKAKKSIIYGLLGMFIMFSAYGLIRLILSTFGISDPQNFVDL